MDTTPLRELLVLRRNTCLLTDVTEAGWGGSGGCLGL